MSANYRLYYPYELLNFSNGKDLYVYAGAPVPVYGSDSPPKNTTAVAPPEIISPNHLAYYDMGKNAWVEAVAIQLVTVARQRTYLLAELDKLFSTSTTQLSSGYTAAERYTWPTQEAEAKTYLETGVATPLLRQLAAANGYTVQLLCQRIMLKANAYRAAYIAMLAKYQQEQNRLKAAVTVEQLRPLTLADLVKMGL